MESALRRSAPAGLRLIETFRWEPGGFVRLLAHRARLARTAAALAVPLDEGALDRALAGVGGDAPLRVRLAVALNGGIEVTTAPLGAARPRWTVAIAGERVRSDDPWLRVKTTERRAYDAARAALPAGIDEMLFLNERDQICEGTITSVFVDLGRGLVTPRLACGLLPGVLRAELLARGARESVLTEPDLRRGRLFVGNSLRGLFAAELVD